MLKLYEISKFDKTDSIIKEKHKQLINFRTYLLQKSHSISKLSQVYFVAQFISSVMEFLLIKEKVKNIWWCSDRGHLASFLDGIIFYLYPNYLYHHLKERVTGFNIHLPAELKENCKEYPYDLFIRIPDIITGVMSSLVTDDIGITVQKSKHGILLHKYIVDNTNMIVAQCSYSKTGQQEWQRVIFESIEKSSAFKYNKEQFKKLQNDIDEKLKNKN